MRCRDLGALLASLGFEIRDGKKGGHKLFFHDELPEFHSGSYNCDHGKNPQIKRPYITKVIRILEVHETDLRKFLGEKT